MNGNVCCRPSPRIATVSAILLVSGQLGQPPSQCVVDSIPTRAALREGSDGMFVMPYEKR